MPAPIAVGFDFDHTLGLDNKLERTVALDMLAALAAADGRTYDATGAEAAIDDVLLAHRQGDMPVEAAIAGFFESFAPAGTRFVDAAQDFREHAIARAPEYVRAQVGADDLLATLDERGIRYALLTNGWSPLQEEKARLIRFRGSVFVSERINARKPTREAFAVLAKHFELEPADIWYVGDDPVADVAGAAAYGMTTVWYDWEGRTYPSDIAPPTHRIAKLDEVLPLLQGRLSEAANS